jgi:hypothetical protein
MVVAKRPNIARVAATSPTWAYRSIRAGCPPAPGASRQGLRPHPPTGLAISITSYCRAAMRKVVFPWVREPGHRANSASGPRCPRGRAAHAATRIDPAVRGDQNACALRAAGRISPALRRSRRSNTLALRLWLAHSGPPGSRGAQHGSLPPQSLEGTCAKQVRVHAVDNSGLFRGPTSLRWHDAERLHSGGCKVFSKSSMPVTFPPSNPR